MSNPEGTKSQQAVLVTLFVLGTLAVIFTSIMTVSLIQDTNNRTATNILEILLFYATIDLIFWVPFFILYKKWHLKWEWGKFTGGDI